MNINYKAENKENKQLNLEKRNKKDSNSGIPKPLLYAGLGVIGLGSLALIGKILYNRSKKSDNNNPGSQQNNQYKNNEINITNNRKIKQTNEWKNLVYDHDIKINGIKLTTADQKWFRTFMILFEQQYPLCWHNASMQFLACPEIRFGEEEYKQEFNEEYPQKIKSMINWINDQIEIKRKDKNLKIEDYFNEKIRIHVPPAVREAPDGKENWLPSKDYDPEDKEPLFGLGDGNDFMFWYKGNGDECYGQFNDRDFTKNIINCDSLFGCDIASDVYKLEQINIGYDKKDMLNNFHIKNKEKGFTLSCSRIFHIKFPIVDLLFQLNNNDFYKPTFFAIGNQGHYTVFYIVYNSDTTFKYAILGDGSQPGFKILNYDEFNNKLESLKKNDKDGFMIRYSPKSIVEKYYTPELMFNN